MLCNSFLAWPFTVKWPGGSLTFPGDYDFEADVHNCPWVCDSFDQAYGIFKVLLYGER